MHVTSIIFYACGVFYPSEVKTYFLTLSQTSPGFHVSAVQVAFKSFEKTVGNGEIARNEQFLLFPKCFQPF